MTTSPEASARSLELESLGQGRYRLSGDLGFATAEQALRVGGRLDGAGGELRIDLSGLSSVDSAGLAVLLEWWRQARLRDVRLMLENAPDQLQGLVTISGLEEILELKAA